MAGRKKIRATRQSGVAAVLANAVLANAGSTSDDALVMIRPGELGEMLDVTMPTLRDWRRRGYLPEPIQLGPHAVGWPRQQILDWVASRPKA